jgi:hypothetical protein
VKKPLETNTQCKLLERMLRRKEEDEKRYSCKEL